MGQLKLEKISRSRNKATKTIKVTELTNMARVLAEKNLEYFGYYFCIYNGEKVEVIK